MFNVTEVLWPEPVVIASTLVVSVFIPLNVTVSPSTDNLPARIAAIAVKASFKLTLSSICIESNAVEERSLGLIEVKANTSFVSSSINLTHPWKSISISYSFYTSYPLESSLINLLLFNMYLRIPKIL